MPEIDVGTERLNYSVRESSEASKARIDVGIDTVRVVVPEESSIIPEKFLRKKIQWVLDRKEEYDSYKAKIPERSFKEGEKIPFLGEEREIKIQNSRGHSVKNGEVILSESYLDDNIEEKVKKVLRKEAKNVIREKVEKFADNVEDDFKKVYVRDQKTKWGSCSPKNNLSFNWRICLGPEKVVDYVVAHEVAHLENKDHDKDFWNKVEEILPDYRKGYKWLKENSHRLVFSKEEFLS